MLNHIVAMGRLTRDPELRRTGAGVAVTSFTIACDRDYSPNGGERETDFIDIVTWRNTAEFAQKYFAKGSMIVVSGRLQFREWTDKDGKKRRNAEVLADNLYFGEGKKQSLPPVSDASSPMEEMTIPHQYPDFSMSDDDEPLPF